MDINVIALFYISSEVPFMFQPSEKYVTYFPYKIKTTLN